MNATTTIKINPKSVIEMHLTNRKRVAWLKRFGPQKNRFIHLIVTVPLDLWEKAGERIRGDGTLAPLSPSGAVASHPHPHPVEHALMKAARKYLLRQGWFGEEDDRADLDELFVETIEKFVGKRVAAEKRAAKEELDKKLEERQRKEDAKDKKRKREAFRNAWISKHGSERLRKALDLGLADKCRRLFMDEYLEVEFEEGDSVPSRYWRWGKGEEEKETRNPSLEALEALEQAKNDPRIDDPVLVYLLWFEDKDEHDRRNVAAVAGRILGTRAYLNIGEIRKTWTGPEEW